MGSVLLAVAQPGRPDVRIALPGLGEDAVPITGIGYRVATRLTGDALAATSLSGLYADVRRGLESLAGGVASGLRNQADPARRGLVAGADKVGTADVIGLFAISGC